jgi:hypothetical protein
MMLRLDLEDEPLGEVENPSGTEEEKEVDQGVSVVDMVCPGGERQVCVSCGTP